eukprot:PhF_6_TR12974/c0_g1_i1/m.20506
MSSGKLFLTETSRVRKNSLKTEVSKDFSSPPPSLLRQPLPPLLRTAFTTATPRTVHGTVSVVTKSLFPQPQNPFGELSREIENANIVLHQSLVGIATYKDNDRRESSDVKLTAGDEDSATPLNSLINHKIHEIMLRCSSLRWMDKLPVITSPNKGGFGGTNTTMNNTLLSDKKSSEVDHPVAAVGVSERHRRLLCPTKTEIEDLDTRLTQYTPRKKLPVGLIKERVERELLYFSNLKESRKKSAKHHLEHVSQINQKEKRLRNTKVQQQINKVEHKDELIHKAEETRSSVMHTGRIRLADILLADMGGIPQWDTLLAIWISAREFAIELAWSKTMKEVLHKIRYGLVRPWRRRRRQRRAATIIQKSVRALLLRRQLMAEVLALQWERDELPECPTPPTTQELYRMMRRFILKKCHEHHQYWRLLNDRWTNVPFFSFLVGNTNATWTDLLNNRTEHYCTVHPIPFAFSLLGQTAQIQPPLPHM